MVPGNKQHTKGITVDMPFLNNAPGAGPGGEFWASQPADSGGDDATLNDLLALYQSANEVAPPFAPLGDPAGVSAASGFAGSASSVDAEIDELIRSFQDTPPLVAQAAPAAPPAAPVLEAPLVTPPIPTAPPVPTFDLQTAPAFEAPLAPALPVFEAPPAPVYEAPPAPLMPVIEIPPAPPAPVFHAPPAPVYEAPPAPIAAPPAPDPLPLPAAAVAPVPLETYAPPPAAQTLTVPAIPVPLQAAANLVVRPITDVALPDIDVADPRGRLALAQQLTEVISNLANGVDQVQVDLDQLYASLAEAAGNRAPVSTILDMTQALQDTKAHVGEESALYKQAALLKQVGEAYMDLLTKL